MKLGADEVTAKAGSLAYMAANLEHRIKVETEVVMLLTMVKAARV